MTEWENASESERKKFGARGVFLNACKKRAWIVLSPHIFVP